MIVWALTAAYILGGIYTWRRITYVIIFDGYQPDSFDYVTGIFLGAMASLIWPVTLAGLIVRDRGGFHGDLRGLLKPPGKERAELQRYQIEEQQRRIKALERELGIK